MNLEQYNSKIKQIEREATLAKRHIAREYVLSNNSISVGDIIADHIGKIIVTEIGVYFSEHPQCAYTGTELKKDGNVTKRKKIRTVYQSNIRD